MSKKIHLSILGGGPAGLAVGYYAQKKQISFTVYEASDVVGGNCRTLKYKQFLLDTGAHRFHDKDPEVTKEIVKLMAKDLVKIHVPTQIYHDSKLIDFPLSPLNLLKNLGIVTFGKASLEVLYNRLTLKKNEQSFEDFAIRTYGKTLSSYFLLNYSQRVWGRPCNQLSLHIAGKRMKGLNLKTFLAETILGNKAKTEHLEGATFYYPKYGIGMITDKIANSCGKNNIKTKHKVGIINHNGSRIKSIEVNGNTIQVDQVINTLPINTFIKLLRPKAPNNILEIAEQLDFRNMVLVVLFIKKPRLTKSATIYFPDGSFPFTRMYEPKNRSPLMSPKNQTSLALEIPCQKNDETWQMKDKEIIQLVSKHVLRLGWFDKSDILDSTVLRLDHAYPILELGYEEKVNTLKQYLETFGNLHLSGRNGKFVYSWLHNMMSYGKTIVQQIAS